MRQPIAPSPEELMDFCLGKCPPERAREIEAFLNATTDGADIMERVPDDALVGHLRGAGNLPTIDGALTAPSDQENNLDALLLDHPRYRMIRKLGQGGMGAVYLAQHRLMDRLVAIKLVKSARAHASGFGERFRQEVRAAAKLSNPHVVTAYDAEEIAGTPFLVMEYVEGESLADWSAQQGPLPSAEACRYVYQAALGLQSAHDLGMVHRDIKPHNLIRAVNGTVKILDFGLAKVVRETSKENGQITSENTLMGTADYLSPEQAKDSRSADIRADIYSLGCTLYHLLSGHAPFPGGTVVEKILQHANARPASIERSDLPQALMDALAKMMAKRPEDRYQTPAEVATALEPFMRDDPRQWPRRLGRRLIPVLAVLGLVLTIAVVLWSKSKVDKPKDSAASKSSENHRDSLPPQFVSDMGMEFVIVPKGTFWMGGGEGKPGNIEKVMPYDFYLGKYEVTREELQKVMGKAPPPEQQKRLPAGNISWDDAQVFLQRMNESEKESAWKYRLPTEVEWEYACRGGPMKDRSESGYDFYFEQPSLKLLPIQANFEREKEITGCAPVGIGKANNLGLYDMHGNMWELCNDRSGKIKRIVRGGGWDCPAKLCRAAGYFPDGKQFATEHYFKWSSLGFRVARVPADLENK